MDPPRYMIVYGIMLAKDGFENIVSKETATQTQIDGLYVYEINEPGKQTCLLFSSMTPVFSSNFPVGLFNTNAISRAESFVLGMFMLRLDPEHSLNIRCASYFVDTTEAKVRTIHAPSSEEVAQIKKRYARARVGDSTEQIRESREIRKAARLGTTDFPKTPENTPHDPEDRSGLDGELELVERAEQLSEKRKAEKARKLSGPWDFVGSMKKRLREQTRPRNQKLPRLQVRSFGIQQRPRKIQGPPPGTKDFRPALQPSTQTQITAGAKTRTKRDKKSEIGSFLPTKIQKIGVCGSGDGVVVSEQCCHPETDDEIISDGDLFGDDIPSGADSPYNSCGNLD